MLSGITQYHSKIFSSELQSVPFPQKNFSSQLCFKDPGASSYNSRVHVTSTRCAVRSENITLRGEEHSNSVICTHPDSSPSNCSPAWELPVPRAGLPAPPTGTLQHWLIAPDGACTDAWMQAFLTCRSFNSSRNPKIFSEIWQEVLLQYSNNYHFIFPLNKIHTTLLDNYI